MSGFTASDLTGLRFGSLVVTHRVDEASPPRWVCQCDCGGRRTVDARELRRGDAWRCLSCRPKRKARLSPKRARKASCMDEPPPFLVCLNEGRLDCEILCPRRCREYIGGPVHHCARIISGVAEAAGGLSHEEIAFVFGVSKSTVVDVEATALAKIGKSVVAQEFGAP